MLRICGEWVFLNAVGRYRGTAWQCSEAEGVRTQDPAVLLLGAPPPRSPARAQRFFFEALFVLAKEVKTISLQAKERTKLEL